MAAVEAVGPDGQRARMTEARLAVLAEQGWTRAGEVDTPQEPAPPAHHPDPEAVGPEEES